jgi:hypothetical protein
MGAAQQTYTTDTNGLSPPLSVAPSQLRMQSAAQFLQQLGKGGGDVENTLYTFNTAERWCHTPSYVFRPQSPALSATLH